MIGAMIPREVIASFTVFVDDRPITELDKKINKTARNIRDVAFVATAAFSGVVYGLHSVSKAASDVVENMNVLNVIFKEGTPSIVAWSKAAGEHMGRSEFALQRYVSDFGALLSSRFEGTGVDVKGMSQQLVARAVDLASFRNVSDQMAVQNLLSGMSGETEAVRKYGIDISDEAMEKWAKAHGSKQTMRAMDMTEKSYIRFMMIMEQTNAALDDAHKTGGTFANQMRNMTDQWEKFKVALGDEILPATLWVVKNMALSLKGAAANVKLLAQETSNFQTALLAVSGYLASSSFLKFCMWASTPGNLVRVLAMGGAFKAMLLPVAGLAASLLAVEDVVTMLRGGDSVFGHMLYDITGVKNPLEALVRTVEDLADALEDAWHNAGKIFKPFDFMGDMQRGALGLELKAAEATGDPAKIAAVKAKMAEAKEPHITTARERRVMERINRGEIQDQSFAEHVRRGDMEGAIAFRRPNESEREAEARATAVRRRLFNYGATPGLPPRGIRVLPGDVKEGLVSPEVLQRQMAAEAQAEAAKQAAASAAAAGVIGPGLRGFAPPGKGPVMVNISNNVNMDVKANASPQEIQGAVGSGLGEANERSLRQADDALGDVGREEP